MYDKLINTCYIYIIQLSRYIKNESETLNLNDIYDCLNSIIPQFHTYSQRGEFERERDLQRLVVVIAVIGRRRYKAEFKITIPPHLQRYKKFPVKRRERN